MASNEKENGGLRQKPCAKEMTYDLKRALSDWDGQAGDEAERCTSGVAQEGRDPLYRLGPCKVVMKT